MTLSQDNLCGPCVLGLQRIKDTIDRPDSILMGELINGCEKLPQSYQGFCRMGVTLGASKLLGYLRTRLADPPKELCTRWMLCDSKYQVEPAQGYLCQACILGVSLIKDYINQPDEVLVQMLVQSCENLPENFVLACKAAFISYGKVLIGLVRDQINESPRVLCEKIAACSPTSQFHLYFKKANKTCSPCQMVAGVAKEWLSKVKDEEIREYLSKACGIVPEDLQPICKIMLVYTSEGLVRGLRTFFENDAKVICARIGLC